MLYGVDVSHHQGVIDWEAVARTASFALAKATQGMSFADSRYAANVAGATAALTAAGAYHFLETGAGAAQGQHYLAVTGRAAGLLRVVDVESYAAAIYHTQLRLGMCREIPGAPPVPRHWDPPPTHEDRVREAWYRGTAVYPSAADATACVGAIRSGLPAGHSVGIYTGPWYWRGILGDPPLPAGAWLWSSRYVSGSGTVEQLAGRVPAAWWTDPLGGVRPTMLQVSSAGAVPGVAGSVDVDLYRGDRAGLLALAGRAAPAPTPIPQEDDMAVSVLSSYANGVWWVALDGRSRTPVTSTPAVHALAAAGVPVHQLPADQMARIPVVDNGVHLAVEQVEEPESILATYRSLLAARTGQEVSSDA